MKIYNINIKIAILFSVILLACDESSQLNEYGIPQIVGISKQSTYHNDLLTIYGKYFGLKSDKAFLVFINQSNNDTLLKLSSNDCIKWTETEIIFKVSEQLTSSNLSVHVNDKSSNKILVLIENIPDLEMIEIPAGTFQMGSAFGFPNERPVHQIRITKKISISKSEISQLLWENVMGYNISIIKAENLPVHNISWFEAVKFCNEISKRMEYDTVYIFLNDSTVILDTTANGYRLPTEAEWEYACKAGQNSEFGGKNPEEIARYNINSGCSPHPSATLLANDFGIYDMNGNVWEWCWDWYSSDYYNISTIDNPLGPATGSKRVLRGGSCASGSAHIRSTNRTYPESELIFCGIRLARTKFD